MSERVDGDLTSGIFIFYFFCSLTVQMRGEANAEGAGRAADESVDGGHLVHCRDGIQSFKDDVAVQ